MPIGTKMNLASLYRLEYQSRTAAKRKQAFTLVELLLVIGVVGILAAILFPTLQSAKERAKRIQCISNEKQLAATWFLYATDHTDKLVANGIPIRVPTPNIKWVQGQFVIPEDSTNEDWILNPQWALYAHYIRSSSIYVCPGDPPNVSYQGTDYPRVRSYAMNNFLGWECIPSPDIPMADWLAPQKVTQIDDPSGTFLLPDVNANSICWPYFGTYMDRDDFFNFPSAVHNGGGVISFCDSHVSYHRWTDPFTISGHSDNYHRHDDPSPGNVDLHWLQNHATHKK
jgi:prepilin-type N-terminal cleavage/methylation domain-containing protein/prepilin-type processing-associated H-X9-DG protein